MTVNAPCLCSAGHLGEHDDEDCQYFDPAVELCPWCKVPTVRHTPEQRAAAEFLMSVVPQLAYKRIEVYPSPSTKLSKSRLNS